MSNNIKNKKVDTTSKFQELAEITMYLFPGSDSQTSSLIYSFFVGVACGVVTLILFQLAVLFSLYSSLNSDNLTNLSMVGLFLSLIVFLAVPSFLVSSVFICGNLISIIRNRAERFVFGFIAGVFIYSRWGDPLIFTSIFTEATDKLSAIALILRIESRTLGNLLLMTLLLIVVLGSLLASTLRSNNKLRELHTQFLRLIILSLFGILLSLANVFTSGFGYILYLITYPVIVAISYIFIFDKAYNLLPIGHGYYFDKFSLLALIVLSVYFSLYQISGLYIDAGYTLDEIRVLTLYSLCVPMCCYTTWLLLEPVE